MLNQSRNQLVSCITAYQRSILRYVLRGACQREDKDQMVTGGLGVRLRPDSGGFTGGSVGGPSPSSPVRGPTIIATSPQRGTKILPSGAASRTGLSGSVAGMHEHDSTGPRELASLRLCLVYEIFWVWIL